MSSRHHPSTRPTGLVRLRRITAGVAVTAAIGTGGFAILAAATFRGTATAASRDAATSGTSGEADPNEIVPRVSSPEPRVNGLGIPDGTNRQVPTVPGRASGRGHVSTGGS
jgi:hypothetical protein